MLKRLTRVWLVIVALAAVSPAKVAPTSIEQLTEGSDLIVIGKVTGLLKVKGVWVGEVQVSRILKGESYSRLYYLAQPTWICDITEGKVGEEALFFFEHYTFDPHPAWFHIFPSFVFKEPHGFRRQVQKLAGNTPFLRVYWAGRGQMPLRMVDGNRYVTLWTGDTRLPPGIPTIAGPEGEYYSFIRSAPLDAITDFVQRQQQASSKPVR